jgi:hypothetical protein
LVVAVATLSIVAVVDLADLVVVVVAMLLHLVALALLAKEIQVVQQLVHTKDRVAVAVLVLLVAQLAVVAHQTNMVVLEVTEALGQMDQHTQVVAVAVQNLDQETVFLLVDLVVVVMDAKVMLVAQ